MPKRKKTGDKWETTRNRRDTSGKIAGEPKVIEAGRKLAECNVAAKRDKVKLVASLTKEMSWDDLDGILSNLWPKSIQKQVNIGRVCTWIRTTVRAQVKNDPLHASMTGIVRSVMALYPLTLDIGETEHAGKRRTRIVLHWLPHLNIVDLISILVHANQILSCTKSILTATSRYRFIKEIISDKKNPDSAAIVCKSIIQFAGESKYQDALNRLTCEYNTKHAVVAKTCRTAEFYRKVGLTVLCVMNHKHLRRCAQYEIARDYFKQSDELPLFFAKLVSVTKSSINVTITDDHDPAYEINQFLLGDRSYPTPIHFTPSTKREDTATAIVPMSPYHSGRLLFESGLPAIADQVEFFMPLVCAHIVIQYVQSTTLEVILNDE
jgi:hypothetical protein